MNHARHGVSAEAHRPKIARIRKVIGIVSTAVWAVGLIQRAVRGPRGRYSYRPSLLTQAYADLSVWIDQRYPWHKLPWPLGLVGKHAAVDHRRARPRGEGQPRIVGGVQPLVV